ncbi:MAG TPA: ankyrin repeat domain-containing protein, partial [Steroidobacteraceae bacterium]
IPRNRSSVDSHLPYHRSICVLLLLLAVAPKAHAAVYKCTALDGSITYSDQPCGANAQAIQVTPQPLHAAPVSAPQPLGPGQVRVNQPQTTTPLTPALIAAARDRSARETSASLCATKAFNNWIKAQGHPLPDPNIRVAKLVEISNQCRRQLGLSDMIPPAPIVAPKPILRGPEGAAAAAHLVDLVKGGSIEQLQQYLSTPGVDINDRPGTDKALLDYAAEQNQARVARFLLEHGARVDATQNQGPNAGYTALHRAASADAAEVARLLLASGAEVNFHGPLGVTPLILAASNGSRRTAEILLDQGADVSTPDGHRETALSEATTRNHPDIVRLLLIHVPTPSSTTLNAIAMRGDVDALSLILRHDELMHDIPITLKDQAIRFTILGPERFEERKQMIELLLADGADIDNQQPGLDVTPVMLAPTPKMAEFLFVHGANKKARLGGPRLAQWLVCNNSGKDPKGTLEVVVAHGIDIKGTTPDGGSALPCAERASNPGLVAFLRVHLVGDGRPKDNAPRSTMATTQEAQLYPKRPCVRLDQIGNSSTPMELYGSLNDCMQNNRDADALSLFVLAGMDSSFDSLRVTDKTAGQARQILIMALFEGMAADVRARFEAAMKDLTEHPQRHELLCEQIKKIGPPQYFPAYMVNHGMGAVQSALSNQAPPAPLEPNFDAAAAWRGLITNYLNCGVGVRDLVHD